MDPLTPSHVHEKVLTSALAVFCASALLANRDARTKVKSLRNKILKVRAGIGPVMSTRRISILPSSANVQFG
jgi:hypothetical protein